MPSNRREQACQDTERAKSHAQNSSIAAVVDGIFEKHCNQLRLSMEKRWDKMEESMKEQKGSIEDVEKRMTSTEQMLSAIAARAFQHMGTGRNRSSLRGQTLAQMSLVKYFLTDDLRARSLSHIMCKYIVAHIEKFRQGFETGTDILDFMLFAPNSANRKRMRQTGVGRAFRDMRYSLASNTVFNCCKYAENLANSNQVIREALSDERGAVQVDREYTVERLDSNDSFLAQTVWTKVGYITNEDIVEGGNEMMRIQTKSRWENGGRVEEEVAEEGDVRKTKKQRTNGKMRTLEREIRIEVVKKIWGKQTEWLNLSRQELRKFITQTLGFLFTEEANAEWSFTVPRIYYGKLSTVENTKVYKGDEILHLQTVDRQNEEILSRLFDKFPKLKLVCS